MLGALTARAPREQGTVDPDPTTAPEPLPLPQPLGPTYAAQLVRAQQRGQSRWRHRGGTSGGEVTKGQAAVSNALSTFNTVQYIAEVPRRPRSWSPSWPRSWPSRPSSEAPCSSSTKPRRWPLGPPGPGSWWPLASSSSLPVARASTPPARALCALLPCRHSLRVRGRPDKPRARPRARRRPRVRAFRETLALAAAPDLKRPRLYTAAPRMVCMAAATEDYAAEEDLSSRWHCRTPGQYLSRLDRHIARAPRLAHFCGRSAGRRWHLATLRTLVHLSVPRAARSLGPSPVRQALAGKHLRPSWHTRARTPAPAPTGPPPRLLPLPPPKQTAPRSSSPTCPGTLTTSRSASTSTRSAA